MKWEFGLPDPEPETFFPKIPPEPRLTPHRKLSTDQIRSMADEELVAFLNGETGDKGMISLPLQQAITTELLRRSIHRASAPHWSVIPSFWLLVATAILAIAALAVAILSLPQVQRLVTPVEKPASSATVDQGTPRTSEPQSLRREAKPASSPRK